MMRIAYSVDANADGLPEQRESMEYLIGVGLEVVVCLLATLVGFDRYRVFYPTQVTLIGCDCICLP